MHSLKIIFFKAGLVPRSSLLVSQASEVSLSFVQETNELISSLMRGRPYQLCCKRTLLSAIEAVH